MTPTRISITVLAAFVLHSGAVAQTFSPRSRDYMFVATAEDARTVWVNPAGLAIAPEASIFGEALLFRPDVGDLRLSQVSVGFNSQGLSFGYNRERLVTDSANHTYTLALARALRGWAVGLAVSHYRSSANDIGFDVGVRYLVLSSLHLGMVVRNLGQPLVRTDTLPATGVAGVGWSLLGRRLILTGEAAVSNRIGVSGYDLRYRAGAALSFGRQFPVRGLTAVLLDEDLGVAMWSFGLSLGGSRRGIFVAGIAPDNSTPQLQTLSITGLAVNRLAPVRR